MRKNADQNNSEYGHFSRSARSIKCGKVCINVSEMNTFTSDFTGGTYNTNHKRGCEDNCLVCLLLCEYCGKQYVGGNTNKLRYRWNN